MKVNFLSPPKISTLSGNEDSQLNKLRNYVFQTVESLNLAFEGVGAKAVLEEINNAVNSSQKEEENKELLSEHNEIRSLIIKTADYAISNSEQFRKILKSEYSAISDFGELEEKLQNEITANSDGINQLFRYTSGIRSEFGDFSTTSEQYIKTGLLYLDDNGAPIYGVGVGNLSTKIDVNGQTVLNKENLLTTTSAEELAFWNGGKKVAYINGNIMYFPSGSLKAYEADISGNIKATTGEIGGCKIVDGVLKVGNANITNLDASKITSGFLSVRNIKFDGVMDILGRETTSESYITKGLFGYETESFLSSYKGLLLESADKNQSMFLNESHSWFYDRGNSKMKILRYRASSVELEYNEDYESDNTGVKASLELDRGSAVLSYYDRSSRYGNCYISLEGDDIAFRFNGKRYFLSEIVDACGL